MSCIVIRKVVTEKDEKLLKPGNDGRKIFATSGVINEFEEKEINSGVWSPGDIFPTEEGDIEISSFTNIARQDRHYHKNTIEIYMVLSGNMLIYITDKKTRYCLKEGDEIVILPGTVHFIDSKKDISFLTRVHSFNSYGASNKFVQLEKNGEWFCWANLSDKDKNTVYNGE